MMMVLAGMLGFVRSRLVPGSLGLGTDCGPGVAAAGFGVIAARLFSSWPPRICPASCRTVMACGLAEKKPEVSYESSNSIVIPPASGRRASMASTPGRRRWPDRLDFRHDAACRRRTRRRRLMDSPPYRESVSMRATVKHFVGMRCDRVLCLNQA